MARQVIKQYDGRYAVFSTIIDQFILWNATVDELIEFTRKEAADEAEERCRLAITRADNEEIKPTGRLDFFDACAKHNQRCAPEDHLEP